MPASYLHYTQNTSTGEIERYVSISNICTIPVLILVFDRLMLVEWEGMPQAYSPE